MYNIYFGLTLSLICLFLIYFILPTFLIVTVICVILAGLYFKDDFVLFRYVATHVASFYSWIYDFFLSIQNMYHQSNNTNFPIRKIVENNGALSRKFDRLHHSSPYNLSTPFVMDNKPMNSGSMWESGSKFSSPLNSFSSSRTQSTLQEMSKLNISHQGKGDNRHITSDRQLSKTYNPSGFSPLTVAHAGYSRSTDLSRSGSSSFPASRNQSANIENNPPLNAKLYADVSSPGFCGRIADRLHEESMTHQSKYDTVGAFPVVNLKSQSPKIKIKTPVRVRLAPPSNELVHYNYGTNTLTRTPVLGPEESMKSVLQVLKEISRKRIHSHVDEDSEESTKRLRVTDSQLDGEGLLHTSLLQQTIQGKRAREESSPNEDDKKRRKASLKNNEIMSSLSSSISVRPPHLQTAKRKAQSIDDSITSTPVLGKLLKVQTEVTPPKPTNHITAPDTAASPATVPEPTAKTSPLLAVPSPIVPPPPPPAVVVPEPPKPPAVEPPAAQVTGVEEDGAVSRLLGRMSDQMTCSRPVNIPIKKDVFSSTNDLSLSPPKENRLAAMIAVLGGPSEQSELEGVQSDAPNQQERLIKGKALFMTPETPATPDTPRQNKKVTFSDSLTTTKIFERDEPDTGSSTVASSNSLAPPSTPLSLFSSSANTTPTGPKLNFASESTIKPFALNFGSPTSTSNKETAKPSESAKLAISASSNIGTGSASPASQTSMFQMPTGPSFNATTSSPSVSASTFSSSAPTSSSSVNVPSPGGFSFGTNSSLTNPSKESLPKQNTDSATVKSFSFGGETKASQPATTPGFPSLFSPVASKNESTKSADAGTTAGQNKPMFNIFGNKDTSTSKTEGDNKPLVNGFAPTSNSSSPFALNQPVNQVNASKPSFASNSNTTTAQSASPFSFGSGTAFSNNTAAAATAAAATAASSTTQQSTPSIFTSTTQQIGLTNSASFQQNSQANTAAPPSLNMFSSSTGNSAQNKPVVFGSGAQSSPAFGDSIFKPIATTSQTSQSNSVFGSTPSQSTGFGSSPALQNGAVSSTSGTTQSSNIFGSMSSTANKPITFGGESNKTQPSSTPVFGFNSATASTQASSPFGITLNNSTPSAPTMFGNTSTAQSTPVFGSGTPSTGSQSSAFPTPNAGQPSLFNSVANNDAAKNIFAGASSSSTFGSVAATPSLFGNQNSSTPTFGGQNTTTAASTFGNQSTSTFSFGSQNSSSNPTGGFNAPPAFGASSSSSSTSEVKPAAFGSGSPFMFGSSTANKPTEAVKPLGTATPFAFGSSAQQNSTNPAQPSMPSFGAPTPTFGVTQPAPTFGGGSSQPAAPTFQFGQATSSAPAPAFQFNAAPPTVGGGMFSIGTGGSTTSRAKTTAIRRSKR